MGNWHHDNIISRIPDIIVVGAFDINEDMMGKIKEKGIFCYETATMLIDDPKVDIVLIATPNDSHKDYCIQALRAKKAVVCEKPVTMNSEELEEIIFVANETKQVFSIHHNRRWDKDFRIVKTILEEGSIGKPYFIESRIQGSRKAIHGWRKYKDNGGGMVLDWGVHLLDQMLWMIDSAVVQVHSHLLSIFTPNVEDNVKIFLRFENGISALLEMTTLSLVPGPHWYILCENGTVVVHGWEGNGKIVKFKTENDLQWDDDGVYTGSGPTRLMAPRPMHTINEHPLPDVTSSWEDYYLNILDALNGRAELIITPQQILRVMKVVDAVFKSDKNNASVNCNI